MRPFQALILFAAFVFSSGAFAKSMPLGEIVQTALERSHLIKAQIQELEAGKLRFEGAGILPNPLFGVQYGSLESADSQGHLLELGLYQSLPFPGKLSSLQRLAEIQKKIIDAEGEQLRLLLQHEVSLLAVRLAVLRELAKHSGERKRRFNLIREYLKTHPQRSPTQRAESALIENQLRLLEKGILELDQEQKAAQYGLQFFLKTQEPISPEVAWVTSPSLPSKEVLEKRLISENIELKRKDLDVSWTEAQLRRAKLDPWPDFNLGFSYRKENLNPSTTFYTGFLTLSVPLFDRGQYSIPANQAKLEAEKLRRESLKGQLELRFHSLYDQAETAAKILRSFPPDLVERAEKQFGDAEIEFRKNRITTTVLLQLDAQVHQTLDSIFESQTSYLNYLSQVLILVGLDLDWK